MAVLLMFLSGILSRLPDPTVLNMYEDCMPGSAAQAEVPALQRRVWRLDRTGRLSNLQLRVEPIQRPAPHEVGIRVKAIGINLADVFAIKGLYAAAPRTSFIPGLEFSGMVETVGQDCDTIKVGDAVYGFTRFGAYATCLNVPERYVRRLQPGWSFAEGASFVVQGLTAWHAMVELGAVRAGQTVLVHSAAGGVGQLALSLCRHLGAYPVASVGSESKVNFLKDKFGLQGHQIIVREKDARGFGRQLDKTLEGIPGSEGFQVILDALGGFYFREGMRVLARGGRMITFGAADYLSTSDNPNWLRIVPRYLTRPTVDPGDLCSQNKAVMGFNLIFLTDKVDELNAELDAMLRYKWDAPTVGSSYAFEDLPAAVAALQSGSTVGKVVVMIPDSQGEEGITGTPREGEK